VTRLLLLCAVLACGGSRVSLDPPSEAARHRAALASITVTNYTTHQLDIAFRSVTPPRQQIGIGSVAPGAQTRLAPVPAGEPIILVARRADGAEYQTLARSFPLDAEWAWIISKDAEFVLPEPAK
jgi:hypothetical protein